MVLLDVNSTMYKRLGKSAQQKDQKQEAGGKVGDSTEQRIKTAKDAIRMLLE